MLHAARPRKSAAGVLGIRRAVLDDPAMIATLPFGATGHRSTRLIFGAAALGAMRREKADAILDLLVGNGINHIDTAASYGDSELRIGPWMREHRSRFFLASKTGDRTREAARTSLHRSLDRLQTDHLDLLQLHNLVDEHEWQTAMGPGGALEALIEARDQGLVRFLGVTGHGTRVAAMHLRSLERFAFASVLVPCNFTMLTIPEYARDFAALRRVCADRNIALQTIKSVARRRWQDDEVKKFSWYEPLREPDALRRAVHFVLGHEEVFLNTSSDATLLPATIAAAESFHARPTDQEMAADVAAQRAEPLFVPGLFEEI
jgi:aryl-alcohol dehydrogenase-like predicted oxidoreductase